MALRRRLVFAVAVMSLGVLHGQRLSAAEWSVTPGFFWSADHDSNRLLIAESTPSQQGFAAGTLKLKRATEMSELSIGGRLGLQRFTNDIAPDSDILSLGAFARRQGEKYSLESKADWSQDSALNTEQSETGLVTGNTVRESRSASGSWTFAHTDRAQISFRAAVEDSSYSGGVSAQLPGYRYPSASLTEQFSLAPQTVIAGSASIGELHSGSGGVNTRDATLSASLQHSFSPRISGFARLGYSEQRAASRTNQGYVARGQIDAAFTLTQISLSIERRNAPSGFGRLVRRDEISASLTRSFSPRVSGYVNLSGTRNHETFFSGLLQERHQYAVAEAGLRWNTTETWTTNLRLTAARAQQFAGSDSIDGYGASLSMNWAPRPFVRSR